MGSWTRRALWALWVVGFAGCAGRGTADFSSISQPLTQVCVRCHGPDQLSELLGKIRAAPATGFTESAFPDAAFPEALRTRTTADLKSAANPPADGSLELSYPNRQSWILHELHELEGLMAEEVPPRFDGQEAFDAFLGFGENGAWEGCEIGDKLDRGHAGDPEGMPTLWAVEAMKLTGLEYVDLKPEERQAIRDYVDAMLPGGLRACSATGGEGS